VAFGSACIDPSFGPTSADVGYWSATTFATNPAYAWLATFDGGLVIRDPKDGHGPWCWAAPEDGAWSALGLELI